jgi:hypothetical protein
MVESAAETQSSEPAPQTDPADPTAPVVPLFEIRLTAVRSNAKIIRSGGIELEVQQDQMMDVQVDDGIKVVKLDGQKEQSYSILDFADYLEAELFSNTSVFVADVRQGAGDSTHVTLHLESGHMFVHLNEEKTIQVTVQTPSATIRILTDGAEFDVCHNEGLTCVFVKKGVVEVTTEDRTELVRAEEASQILKDQRPSPTICAPLSRFTDWEESYRQSADTPALGKEISELPQEACPVTEAGLPFNAHILYQDQFVNPFSGWARGKIDNFIVRYAGLKYYRVQAQDFDNQFLAFVPKEREYEDVNIDVRAIAEAESTGDFRYGMVFRRSGDQYYAFTVSPVTKTWHFLKSSTAGIETLKEGTDERMRGLDSKETLRVESYGSTFLVFINGRFIALISDPEYASGEVGLFIETLDNADAMIRFDSIVLWDMTPVTLIPDTGGREYCFNTIDDDGDRLIDRSDPDCQRLDRTATPLPLPTKTSIPPKTSTPQPTNTHIPQPTNTLIPQPTKTLIPQPTNTPMPSPTKPTKTPKPKPTRTPTNPPLPTATNPPTDPPPTSYP